MISESLATKLDLEHFKQDTFSRTFTINSGSFDFTNYTCASKIYRDAGSTTALVTFTVVLSAGTISLTAPASAFSSLEAGTYEWEMKFTLPDGSIRTWFIGYFKLYRGSSGATTSETITVTTGTSTVSVTVTSIPSVIGWSYGNDAAMALKDAELTASGALAGSYIFFNTTSNSPFFWNGSNFV